MKIVEMATKDLKYNIDFVDKAVEGFERLNPIFKVLLWVKYDPTNMTTEKSVTGEVN